jgi:hypothetical protein
MSGEDFRFAATCDPCLRFVQQQLALESSIPSCQLNFLGVPVGQCICWRPKDSLMRFLPDTCHFDIPVAIPKILCPAYWTTLWSQLVEDTIAFMATPLFST